MLAAALASTYTFAAARRVIVVIALAALLHIAADFPVHAGGAHAPFRPFSDWRFNSPVCYWDRDHHGQLVGPVEATIGVICAIIRSRRFPAIWVKVVGVVACLPYLLGVAVMPAGRP